MAQIAHQKADYDEDAIARAAQQGVHDALATYPGELPSYKSKISAHPALASQQFYTRIGCTDAEERNAVLVERDPHDIQMEYQL